MTRKIDGLSKLKRYYPIKEKEERGSMGRTKEEILGIMSLSMKKSEDKVNDNVSKKDDDKFPDKGINIV